MEPPSTVYPKKADTVAMMKAKNSDFMIPHQTYQSTNVYCKPNSRLVDVIIPPNQQVAAAKKQERSKEEKINNAPVIKMARHEEPRYD